MSRLHEPLTLPKHPVLLHRINDLSIAIKVHHILKDKSITSYEEPKWEDVIMILRDCYYAIDEQRENPRKY